MMAGRKAMKWFQAAGFYFVLALGILLVAAQSLVPITVQYSLGIPSGAVALILVAVLAVAWAFFPSRLFRKRRYHKVEMGVRNLLIAVILTGMIVTGVSAALHRPPTATYIPETSKIPLLIQPSAPSVHNIAKDFTTLQQAYEYVQVLPYLPDEDIGYADYWQSATETLQRGGGDCEDKAILLVSLWRAMGVPADNVWVVNGFIHTSQGYGGHSWVEILWFENRGGVSLTRYRQHIDPTSDIPWDKYAADPYPLFSIYDINIYFNDSGVLVPLPPPIFS